MKKCSQWVRRFCREHPNFGIEGLMRYIVIGTVAVYLLRMFSNSQSVAFLALDWGALTRGEIWRIFTFVFMPNNSSPLWFALEMYCCYFIGNSLEQHWGKARFSLYFLSGWLLSVLSFLLGGLLFSYNFYLSGLTYIYLALFAAFAILFPDVQFLFFFVIPVKAKWFAILDGVYFLWIIMGNFFIQNWAGVVLPLIAVLNFFVFFYDEIQQFLGRGKPSYQSTPRNHFQQKAKQAEKKKEAFRHRCTVCGRTDVSHSNLQFRYCSRCSGYHCYCEEHIFQHTHVEDATEK